MRRKIRKEKRVILLNRKLVEDDQIFESRSSSSGANACLSADTVDVALVANRDITFELLTVLSGLIGSNESEASVLEVNRIFIVNWSLKIISPSRWILRFKSDKSLATAILENWEVFSKRSVDDFAVIDRVLNRIGKGRAVARTSWIDAEIDKIAAFKVKVDGNIGVESIGEKVDVEAELANAGLLAGIRSVELRVDDSKVEFLVISENRLRKYSSAQ